MGATNNSLNKWNTPEGIGVIFILTVLLLCPFLSPWFGAQLSFGKLLYSRFLYVLCLFLIWQYAKQKESRRFLLWDEKKLHFLLYPVHLITLYLSVVLAMGIVQIYFKIGTSEGISSKLVELKPLLHEHNWLIVFISLVAGVTEELIFRGYIQPRLERIMGNPGKAIVLTSVLFGLLHIGYGTVINMVGPMVVGLLFSIHYWKFRNIKVLIMCHFLIDVVSLTFLTFR